MATYTNRPISKACQLAELKNRGLVVGDDNQAIEYLGSINYFRFHVICSRLRLILQPINMP